jgi:polyisoprenoid-binding protein YceI
MRLVGLVGAGVVMTAVLAGGAAGQGPAVGAQRFVIDVGHSHVGFSARHMMVANVKGKFQKFAGEILLDPADVTKSTVEVTIETASVDSDNERRDADLRSANFLDVEQFPEMKFVGKRIEKSGEEMVLVGDLTMRGVTKEVRMPFELIGPLDAGNGRMRLGAEGGLRISRKEWGLTWNREVAGGVLVSDEVRIEINVEASTPRPPAGAGTAGR